MSTLRWIAFLLLLAISAVFFGSALCPPAPERRVAPEPELREGLADPVAVPLEGLEIPAHEEIPVARETRYFDVEVHVVDAHSGAWIPDSSIIWRYEDATGRLQRSSAVAASGRLTLESLPVGEYEITVLASGSFMLSDLVYLPPEKQYVTIPAPEPVSIRFELEAAGLISGVVQSTDGERVGSGWLRFEEQESGRRIDKKIGAGDRFRSPPLRPGVYRVSCLRHPEDPPDPRLTLDIAVQPQQRYVLLVTVPGKASEALPDRAVGIVFR